MQHEWLNRHADIGVGAMVVTLPNGRYIAQRACQATQEAEGRSLQHQLNRCSIGASTSATASVRLLKATCWVRVTG